MLPGARILAWDLEAAQALESARVPCQTVAGVLGPAARDAADVAAIAWTKQLGRRPLRDGRSFRQLLAWKGVPLYYFAELFLHHSTAAAGYVRAIDTFDRLLAELAPTEVEVAGLLPAEALLLRRACTARGVLCHAADAPPRAPGALRASIESRWNNAKMVLGAVKTALGGKPRRETGPGRRVLFLSHAAFWKNRRDPATGEDVEYEHYFDALLPRVAQEPELRPWVLAVGPRAAFRRRDARARLVEWLRLHPEAGPYVHVNRFTSRRVAAQVLRATRQVRLLWRSLDGSAGIHEAFSHRGVPFYDLARRDFAATLLLQLPWAVRCYEEMAEALAHVAPSLVVLYAESSGWGRAAVAACRAQGVPSLALQHGILYPRYFSYLHDPDEADCPRPDLTAVFGEAAKRFLVEQGGYAPESLAVTGSPKFDEMIALKRSLDREAVRRRLGAGPEHKLVLVASRFRGIRDTHQAIGSALPGLLRAVERLPGVRLVVKPHPAESPAPYESAARRAGAIDLRVTAPKAGLDELLVAADALVTVESLAAVEALVLDRPVLVLNMPTNLAEMVDQGMALGVDVGADPETALRLLLFDSETREALRRARERYLRDVAHGADGQATARLVALVRRLAGA